MALDFQERLPEDVPSALPVFDLREPGSRSAAEGLADAARRFGLAGTADETVSSEDWAIHREGFAELAVHALSGALRYRKRGRYPRLSDTYELDDGAAERVADEFVRQAGLLDPEEAGVRVEESSQVLGVTHLRLGGASVDGGDRTEQVIDSGVVYGRVLDGHPVEGPGGEMMVNVDAGGEVFSLQKVWRPIGGVNADVRILPPDQAYDTMEKLAKRLRGDVTVTKARFGYFEHGYDVKQSHLQPAYSMVYVVVDGDVAYKSAEVVHAGERQFEALHREKKNPGKPQRKREPTKK